MEVALNVRKLTCFYNLCPLYIKSFLPHTKQIRLASTADSKTEKYAINADEDYERLYLEKESEIDIRRNKSRLKPHHQNIVNNRIPYSEPMAEPHLTFRYQRTMFGKYGKSSDVNPGSLWPTKSDISKIIEYESVAYPFSFSQLVDKQKQIKAEEQRQINERQEKILKNLLKLDAWKKDIKARADKKLADIAKSKAKKDALIEEVRRHFGYKIDPKDEKFKEMLLLKERAHKKKLKEEKAKVKQERLITQLMEQEKQKSNQ